MNQFTSEELNTLKNAIQYWIANWDFECPTLFGIEKSDLLEVSANWPNALDDDTERALVSCLGSLREMLHGASAINEQAVAATLGVSYDQASVLCSVIHSQCQHAL
jgi:hypothetical protein